jgi:uncharacterized membrane protein AbrB (regulator of aidB expression)
VTGFAALVGGVALGMVFQRYGAGTAFLASAAGGMALVLAWPVVQQVGTRERASTPPSSTSVD